MPVLEQYSIVSQVPGAEPYTLQAYSGTDLTQVLGITQARLPPRHYGWIQQGGHAVVRVIGQTQAAYVDFGPNAAKRELQQLSMDPNKQSAPGQYRLSRDVLERLSHLPPLLMEDGPYCRLVREARDVFVDGHFYACVAMCGISLERFQRDRAVPYGGKANHKMSRIRTILRRNKALLPKTLSLCSDMARLRNKYAHGHGLSPEEDALKALSWMHSFVESETSLMRDYVIVDGILNRKPIGR